MKLTVLSLLFLALSGTANASLETRPGGMVYDTDLNITWLADANYAQTSGYDADGLMTWQDANDWVNNLTYGGYNDWRLPSTPDANTSVGFNQTSSEFGHLFYTELGGTAGSAIPNSNLFTNVKIWAWWSGTEYSANPANVWYFNTVVGHQGNTGKFNLSTNKFNEMYAWAVRSGDVAPVPLPGAIWLFGSGIIGLLSCKRRNKIG